MLAEAGDKGQGQVCGEGEVDGMPLQVEGKVLPVWSAYRL